MRARRAGSPGRRAVIGGIKPRSLEYDADGSVHLAQLLLAALGTPGQWLVAKFLGLFELDTAAFAPVGIHWHKTSPRKSLRNTRLIQPLHYISFYTDRQAWKIKVSVPKIVGEILKSRAGGFIPSSGVVGQATPTPAVINPLAMPDQFLYPRTVLALIFILPITCSVGLFVQGTSGCQSKTR